KYGNMGFVTLGPQARLARSYMKTVKSHVGWAKGGWNMGVVAFGGIVKTGWVARHGTARGSVIKDFDNPNPSVTVINNTGWARNNNAEGERIMRNAINTRLRDMYSYAERMCRLAAERATYASRAA